MCELACGVSGMRRKHKAGVWKDERSRTRSGNCPFRAVCMDVVMTARGTGLACQVSRDSLVES
jgi:hypothetical protein